MTLAVDLEKLPPPARKALSADAPAPLRMMAAKGVLPGVKPGDVVTVVAVLSESSDAAVAETARATLAKLPAPILTGALSADLEPLVLEKLADSYGSDAATVVKLIRMPRITTAALERLAVAADELCGEIIATNEQLMLQHPTVIEKLYMNKLVRMSTADRLIELAVRNQIELNIPAFKQAAQAILNELIPEPSEEPTYDDILFQRTERIAENADDKPDDEDTHTLDDEGEEKVKDEFLPLYAQVAQMTISQKVRAAQLGNAAIRLLLVRDTNRLVATAAARSPLMRENEAVLISASRNVGEEVLRELALNREFTRNYQVKFNLISNPRTPFTFASRLIPHLRESDLRMLAKSKNVSSAVSQAVRQQLERRRPS